MTRPQQVADLTSSTGERPHEGVLMVMCLALIGVTIQTSILSTALPTLGRDLGASDSELHWIMDSYILGFASVLVIGGSLADRFGRRRVMNLGLMICLTFSILAALAQDPLHLITSRAVMGVGAALIVPATLSILISVFTDAHERRRVIATWSLMNAVGAFIGPVAGGLLLLRLPWQWCICITIPVIVVTLVLSRRDVPHDLPHGEPAAFDILGAVLSLVTLVSLVWAVIEGANLGWSSPWIVGAFVLAALSGASFVKWELIAKKPILDLSMFRSRQVSGAVIALMVAFFAMSGTMYLAQLGMQLGKGYSPLAAAVAFSVPVTIVNLLVVPRSPWLIRRVGVRVMLSAGTATVAVSTLVIATMTRTSGYLTLGIGFALMALAFSVIAPASIEAIMAAVPPERSGGASALTQLSNQVSAALSIAVGGAIAAAQYRQQLDLSGVGLGAEATNKATSSFSEALQVATTLTDSAREAFLLAARDAYLMGIRYALIVSAVVALTGAVCAAVALPRQLERSRGRRLLAGSEQVAVAPK